jgi:hypothetical protein
MVPLRRRKTMQNMRRVGVVAGIVALAAAVPAASLGAKPVAIDHESFVDGPNPGEWCGALSGTWSSSGTFTFRADATGAFHATQRATSVFTAATGKSLEVSEAGVDMGAGVDNGDGTMTFTEQTAGLAVTFKVPNGPMLKDADGKPLLGAGVLDSAATFDVATGDLVSLQETWHGPHPFRDGVDVCGPTTAYLAS